MVTLYIVAGIGLLISFLIDQEKTLQGLKKGILKLKKTMPNYLKMLIIISIVLLFSEDLILQTLGHDNIMIGLVSSLFIGSITMMPGFIAYPLAKILVVKGVSYMVITGFVTSLMLVGVVTYPIEKEYFGHHATILRNIMSFAVAALIAITAGFLYGEVTL